MLLIKNIVEGLNEKLFATVNDFKLLTSVKNTLKLCMTDKDKVVSYQADLIYNMMHNLILNELRPSSNKANPLIVEIN